MAGGQRVALTFRVARKEDARLRARGRKGREGFSHHGEHGEHGESEPIFRKFHLFSGFWDFF
jgi:hypothetical protein